MPSLEMGKKIRRRARASSELQKKFAILSAVGPTRVRLALPGRFEEKKAARLPFLPTGSHFH
jgi:hypothetical protein